ncbi:MAG: 4-hydroxy-tetrahydrodipicolinate reductase [Candidatus Omnitrophota bacterium]
MIKIGVIGARGRMGRRIIELAKQDKDLLVSVGFEISGHPDTGKVIEKVKITDNFDQAENCDCLIDFSSPDAGLKGLPSFIKLKKSIVIGTTGLQQEDLDKIKEASKYVPVVFSPNMSIGVTLLFKLLKQAAKTLKGYEVEVQEAHHIHKKDSPSGTAKKIVEVINNQGFNIKIKDVRAVRQGEIIGDHKVVFESSADKIVLGHYAKNRDIFAKGALTAAKWVVNKDKGLYSMEDVLGL